MIFVHKLFKEKQMGRKMNNIHEAKRNKKTIQKFRIQTKNKTIPNSVIVYFYSFFLEYRDKIEILFAAIWDI